jgi:hypothetical protein
MLFVFLYVLNIPPELFFPTLFFPPRGVCCFQIHFLRKIYDLTNLLDELVAFCVLYFAHQAYFLFVYTSDRHFARRDTFPSAKAHAQLDALTIHNVVGSLSWLSYCLTGNFSAMNTYIGLDEKNSICEYANHQFFSKLKLPRTLWAKLEPEKSPGFSQAIWGHRILWVELIQ